MDNEVLDLPIVNPESIIIHPDGELPKGLYYYVISARREEKEIISSHVLQVYAPNKYNSIEFAWRYPWLAEYKIYRGTEFGKYDGYFTIDTEWFCDDGRGELNLNICQ